MDDKHNIKDRILKDVGKSIKLIQQLSIGIENNEGLCSGGGCGGGSLNCNSWLVQSLCCHIDLAFRHGLREPLHGFWPLLQDLSHSDTFQVIEGLPNICSPLGKGLVWLHHTLMEGTLQSYLQCLILDKSTVHRYYTSKAILHDTSSSQQLLTLLVGLENISFNMNSDGGELQEASGFSGLTSMTSSLSSPVDSGVALLDSDADVTSNNEATVTEGDAISLKEDEAVSAELEDNRINDVIISQESDQAALSTISRYIVKQESALGIGVLENEGECGKLISIPNKQFSQTIGQDYVQDICPENYSSSIDSASVYGEGKKEQIKIPVKIEEDYTITTNLENEINPVNKTASTTLSSSSCFYESPDANRMIESCTALAECKQECLDEESYGSSNPTSNKQRGLDNVMSKSVGAETTVVRRQRKKMRNGPDLKVKRVSFHEDLLNRSVESTSVFSASFLPPNPVIKCDVVKGRYSWCAEGDSPFFEQRKSNDTRSDVFLSASVGVVSKENNASDLEQNYSFSENKISSKVDNMSTGNMKMSCSKSSLLDSKLPPVTERGMPEGQEDPPKTSSLLHLNSITDSVLKKFPSISSSIDWSSDAESDVCEHRVNKTSGLACRKEDRRMSSKCQSALLKFSNFMSPSKTSLLKKFMKSITEKKYTMKKNKLRKYKPLYIPGATPDPIIVGQSLAELDNIRAHMSGVTKSDSPVGTTFKNTLKESIFHDSSEDLHKVFKVNSSYLREGKNEPLLIVLSANALYFVGLKNHISYYLYLMINYNELEAIVVGPSRQTLLFSSSSKKQILVISSDSITTGDVVSNIEVAMRKSSMKSSLPVVKELELEDMKTLKLHLSRKCMLLDDEELHHYSIVHLQDNPTSPPSTPLGPEKEGYLMFRPATVTPLQPWEPGYFILKGGVVYMFSDQENRLPKRAIPLHGGQCQGCHRISHESRPHTFEIILGQKRSFQFAAADEYETSEWLQALVQAASGFYEMEPVNTISCSLVLTSGHIIACQEKFSSGAVSVLTCAAIADLLSFSIVSTEECWCILEFACHEVHESSGDWAVYFSTPHQMLTFKHDLEELWSKTVKVGFPLHTINNVALCQRCEETSHYISSVWDEVFCDH